MNTNISFFQRKIHDFNNVHDDVDWTKLEIRDREIIIVNFVLHKYFGIVRKPALQQFWTAETVLVRNLKIENGDDVVSEID